MRKKFPRIPNEKAAEFPTYGAMRNFLSKSGRKWGKTSLNRL